MIKFGLMLNNIVRKFLKYCICYILFEFLLMQFLYFAVKHEMEMTSLTKINSVSGVVLPESILHKALYNKFSQNPRLKHLLLSTRVASIYFTKETCQCNSYDNELPDSKSIVKSDPKILG